MNTHTSIYRMVSILAFILTGCQPVPDTSMQTTSPVAHNEPEMKPAVGPRFTVTHVGIFRDTIAYDSMRGIYVITDIQTGKEYVGVSGIGIAETGEHQAGKTRHEDER